MCGRWGREDQKIKVGLAWAPWDPVWGGGSPYWAPGYVPVALHDIGTRHPCLSVSGCDCYRATAEVRAQPLMSSSFRWLSCLSSCRSTLWLQMCVFSLSPGNPTSSCQLGQKLPDPWTITPAHWNIVLEHNSQMYYFFLSKRVTKIHKIATVISNKLGCCFCSSSSNSCCCCCCY